MGTFTAKMAWDGARTKDGVPCRASGDRVCHLHLDPLDRPHAHTVQACELYAKELATPLRWLLAG
jgi:hypothetical protein